MRRSISMLLTVLCLSVVVSALPQGRPGGGSERGGDSEKSKDKKEKIKPYDEIIKEDYESSQGLFRVHTGDDKVFFEIPKNALEEDLLWVTQLAETQAGFGYGGTGIGRRVVRWEIRGDDVLLRDIKYKIRGDEEDTIQHSVRATSLAPIIEIFPIKAWGKDKAPVIDVTDLYIGDLPEFSAKRRLDASGVDKKRSFVETVKAFPENIETKVFMTYKLSSKSSSSSPSRSPRRSATRRDRSQGAVTVKLHHSMIKLPEMPALPREHDDRVGFFSVSFEDYDGIDHEVETIRYITRWRLEKKNPEAEVSEPKKPIVFYVGRGVPEKWRPYVHKGIEMWQPAFEAAGFKNAILAMDPPTKREDPDWDAEDARYSSIRWLPSTVENAMGPHVNDPRTGEILEADILMYHNVIKLVRDWYFVQASASDPSAQTLPLPDETIGNALAYVVAHEVGHSLGFPHNMKASSSFSVAQLRDAEFTAQNGCEASIMDYGRFNYVAQPGDGATLIPKVGPYDFFAVQWGYRQYGSEKERQEGMGQLVAKQIDDPVLRFGNPNPAEDPTQQTEDLGSDPIAATELGLKNLDLIAGYLVEACCQEGEDYALLDNMYGELLGQRNRELGHVANLVGGFVRTNLWYGDADSRFGPIPPDKQREAIRFLHENAFTTPTSLIREDILQRLESSGIVDRILSSQKRILSSLINTNRVDRMAEHNERSRESTYSPLELMEDITNGIWSELASFPVEIDLYRRNLQRAHVDMLASNLGEDADSSSDLPALARGELANLLSVISYAIDHKSEKTTGLHLADMQSRIREHLNPLLENDPVTGTPIIEASAPRRR